MSYTWKDIKLITLQKMFAADGNQIVNDESTKDYLAGMPYAANEGLQRLLTAGKFLTKSIVLNHMPAKNLIPETVATSVNPGNKTFTVDNGKSYYFQYSGIGTAVINGTETINLNSYGSYKEYKGNYDGITSIVFHSDYPANVKNIAIYDSAFPSDDLVPEYGKYVKYDLKSLADDFYNLFDNSIVYESGNTPYYLSTTDYYRESDHILVLPENMPGMYTIYYHAYPTEITELTDDDYVMEIDPDVAVLLPIYMASVLYMDDDNGIATSYRNYFEVGLESLINTSSYSGKETFTSEWV